MNATNIVAHELESYGVHTFSTKEMAFNILTLMHPQKKSELRRVIARDNSADFQVMNGVEAEWLIHTVNVTPCAKFRFNFPPLMPMESLKSKSQLRGMIDLDKVIDITGFAEVAFARPNL
jgi:fatty acid synthase subunit alpha